MINRNTLVTVAVLKGQYRMTLEEALNYCSEGYGKYGSNLMVGAFPEMMD